MNTQDHKAYIAMFAVILIWGMEFIAAKIALSVLAPLTLLFFRYTILIVIACILKYRKEPKTRLQKQHVPKMILAAVTGTTFYYYFEYSSLKTISVSTLSIILAAVPIVSMLIETIIYKMPITKKNIISILLSVSGVILIIGLDLKDLACGSASGYIYAFLAVLAWNGYNFFIKDMHEKYSEVNILFYQTIFAMISMTPFALVNLPRLGDLSLKVILSVIYLGIMSSTIANILYIYSIGKIGVTPVTIFSNFLPAITIVLSWAILKDTITWTQIIGGTLVMLAVYIVIRKKRLPEDDDQD